MLSTPFHMDDTPVLVMVDTADARLAAVVPDVVSSGDFTPVALLEETMVGDANIAGGDATPTLTH